MRFLLLIFPLTILVFFIASCGGNSKKPLQAQYHEQWDEPNGWHLTNIGKVLIKKGVKTCGEYYVRQSKDQEGEWLIACTPDGQSWNYFQVWVGIDEAQQVIDESIVPPTRS